MRNLVVVDVGGTTIKYGLWNETTKEISDKGSVYTPKTIDEFYGILEFIADKYDRERLDGMGISIPGAVDQVKGEIGGISALPYIHNFPIQKTLEQRLGINVTMENDANCAALAEISLGAAKDMQNILFLIIGTGVGGSVVINRQIVHGSHLYGGEFGMMIGNHYQQLSLFGTAVHLAERYNQDHETELTGKEVLDLADEGNISAQVATQVMYENLAQAIYNLQFVTDPEAVIIGGGVSANAQFIKNLDLELDKLMSAMGHIPIKPKLLAAKYHNDANLIGAAYNFYN